MKISYEYTIPASIAIGNCPSRDEMKCAHPDNPYEEKVQLAYEIGCQEIINERLCPMLNRE